MLAQYGRRGGIITDDNQLLAYGKSVARSRFLGRLGDENFDQIEQVKNGALGQ
jgi:hypothetical protein